MLLHVRGTFTKLRDRKPPTADVIPVLEKQRNLTVGGLFSASLILPDLGYYNTSRLRKRAAARPGTLGGVWGGDGGIGLHVPRWQRVPRNPRATE